MRSNQKKLGIVLAAVFIIILVAIIPRIPTPNGIQKFDIIELNYTIWESDRYKNYNFLNPLREFEHIILDVIPITDDPERGLILGLYNNLIGKEDNYESEPIWLEKCVDQNRDGIDDTTGEPALSYGNSTDQYFGMYLMIQFKILDVIKSE